MLFKNKYNISEKIVWGIIIVCFLPFLFNLLGVKFGTVESKLDPYKITKFVELQGEEGLRDIFFGYNFHTIFVSFTITVAFLTAILSFIDFRIKGDISTPIVGIALFCSGLLDVFHILVSTQIIHLANEQFYVTSFTWFFCRLFHASILILGVGIFLLKTDWFLQESERNARKFVTYITIIFVSLTLITMVMLINSNVSHSGYPFRNIARPYDLIPLGLYLISAFYLFPKFYKKHPSIFSQTLLLSMLPAIATQLYMTFGSIELFDNSFNISHFLTAFTYFIPFTGLGLNYLQTHKNEQKIIGQLNNEVGERIRAEENLSGVLNSSLSAIIGLKALRNENQKIYDFEITLLNPASANIFEIDYQKSIGKKLSETFLLSSHDGWQEMFVKVTETGEDLHYEYFSQDLQKWLLMVAVNLNGGIAVTISDISKRKNALRELMESQKFSVTGKLSRTIAHEIRNPLTNINMSADQLKESLDQDRETMEIYIDIIKRNSERINQLITELLNVSKPATLNMQKISVNQIIEDSLQQAIDRIHLKKIKMMKNLDKNVPYVMLDREKMKTAFLNIIINAVEAMEEDKGVLTINTRKAGEHCIVEIADNGFGISPNNLQNLFQPFFSQKTKGMGLGLTASHNIIMTHKGSIDVESKEGEGTKFTIAL